MTSTRQYMLQAALALIMLSGSATFAQTRTDSSYSNMPNYHASFEHLAPWGGSYTNINISNGWYSSSPEDQSVITNLGTYAFSSCTLPLPTSTHTNVLHLATQGTILTNDFTLGHDGLSGYDMSSQIIYMDTMIQFVASESAPAALITRDATDALLGIKASVYADVSTNLIIYCGTCDTYGYTISNVLVNTGIRLNATNWYRLTIAFDASFTSHNDIPNIEVFQILINGVAVTNSTGYAFDNTWQTYATSGYLPTPDAVSQGGATPPSSGTWFLSANCKQGSSRKLTAIAFQGTGYIDDLVVTNGAPTYTLAQSSFLITVNFSGNGSASTNGLAALLGSPSTFSSAGITSIVYTAQDWYRINTLQVSNSLSVAAAQGVKVYTQMLGTVTGDITNTVAFYQPAATNINPGYTNVSTAWLAAWGQPESTSLHNNGAFNLQQEYLLNVNPFIAEVYGFNVTAFAVTNATVAVSVSLTTNAVPYASTLHGTLALYGQTNLTSAFTQVGTTNLSGSTATFHVNSTNTFYRAAIQ